MVPKNIFLRNYLLKGEIKLQTEAVANYLVNWLKEKVSEAGAEGIVYGISGGIDSAVAGALVKRAFPSKSLGLILPCETLLEDIIHARRFAEDFNIPYKIITLDNAYNLLLKLLNPHFHGLPNTQLAASNIKPRLRMITMYYAAQANNYLVLGTTNKSELKVGYSTKHGDSGVDLQLLGDLVKYEVYELARYLGIPETIINKPPSAGLWEGQTDEEEMGVNYTQLDTYVETGIGEPDVIHIIENLAAKSEHKRKMPPFPVIPVALKNSN